MRAPAWRQLRAAAALGSLLVLAVALTAEGAVTWGGVWAVAAGALVSGAVAWAIERLPAAVRPRVRVAALVLGALVVSMGVPTWGLLLLAALPGLVAPLPWLVDRWPDLAVAAGLVLLTMAASSTRLPAWTLLAWLACALTAAVASVAARLAAARPISGGITSARRSGLARWSWCWLPLALAVVLGPVVSALARALTDQQSSPRAGRSGRRQPQPEPSDDGAYGILDQLRSGLQRLGSGFSRLFRAGAADGGTGAAPPPAEGGVRWWLVLLVVALAAALVAVITWWLWRRRGARAEGSWDERAVRDLERIGRRLGRPRQPAETVDRYAAALARAGGVPEVAGVGPVLSASLFGPTAVAGPARAQVHSAIRSLGQAQRRASRRRRLGLVLGRRRAPEAPGPDLPLRRGPAEHA